VVDAKVKGSKKVRIAGEKMLLNPKMQLFTVDYQNFRQSRTPACFEMSVFRPVTMQAPDFDVVIQVLLTVYGFAHSSTLTKKILYLKSQAEEKMPGVGRKIFTLKFLKEVLNVAKELRDADVSISEENEENVIVANAIKVQMGCKVTKGNFANQNVFLLSFFLFFCSVCSRK
jgi:hypothetical protein